MAYNSTPTRTWDRNTPDDGDLIQAEVLRIYANTNDSILGSLTRDFSIKDLTLAGKATIGGTAGKGMIHGEDKGLEYLSNALEAAGVYTLADIGNPLRIKHNGSGATASGVPAYTTVISSATNGSAGSAVSWTDLLSINKDIVNFKSLSINYGAAKVWPFIATGTVAGSTTGYFILQLPVIADNQRFAYRLRLDSFSMSPEYNLIVCGQFETGTSFAVTNGSAWVEGSVANLTPTVTIVRSAAKTLICFGGATDAHTNLRWSLDFIGGLASTLLDDSANYTGSVSATLPAGTSLAIPYVSQFGTNVHINGNISKHSTAVSSLLNIDLLGTGAGSRQLQINKTNGISGNPPTASGLEIYDGQLTSALKVSLQAIGDSYINTSGGLAIGTTTASGYKLYVSGTSRFTGASTFDALITADSLTVTNALSANGHVTLGNASVDIITINGTISGTAQGIISNGVIPSVALGTHANVNSTGFPVAVTISSMLKINKTIIFGLAFKGNVIATGTLSLIRFTLGGISLTGAVATGSFNGKVSTSGYNNVWDAYIDGSSVALRAYGLTSVGEIFASGSLILTLA